VFHARRTKEKIASRTCSASHPSQAQQASNVTTPMSPASTQWRAAPTSARFDLTTLSRRTSLTASNNISAYRLSSGLVGTLHQSGSGANGAIGGSNNLRRSVARAWSVGNKALPLAAASQARRARQALPRCGTAYFARRGSSLAMQIVLCTARFVSAPSSSLLSPLGTVNEKSLVGVPLWISMQNQPVLSAIVR